MDLPSITVVTPSYNQGAFIRQTIDSVLAQEYSRLEYRVLDGGSTDETSAILRSYGSAFWWRSQADSGQTAAINEGWRMGSGEILCWLNSDDIFFPGALQQAGRFFQDHPGIDVVYGDCDYVDAHGNLLQPYPTRPFDMRGFVSDTINYIPQPATFIRRRVFDGIGPLDEQLKYVMDFDYWLRAGVGHGVQYVPQKWAALRLHPSAKSIASLGRFADELVLIYQKFFGQPALPAELRAVEKQALANIYTRAMDCAFWAGDVSKARRFAMQGWKHAPLRPRRLWIYLLLGKAGLRLAQRRLKNPYLGGDNTLSERPA